MSRIAHCPACSAQESGVKTRIALEHTCGLESRELNAEIRKYNKESYEKEYSCQLSEPEALFPRNILQPIYENYLQHYASRANPTAYDFFLFLLKQVKNDKQISKEG